MYRSISSGFSNSCHTREVLVPVSTSKKMKRLFMKLILTISLSLGLHGIFSFNNNARQKQTNIKNGLSKISIGGRTHPASLELEMNMKSQHRKWFERYIPILYDLVVVDGTYYAIFNVDGNVGRANEKKYLDYSEHHEWWCDNKPGRFVDGDSLFHTLIIQCESVTKEIKSIPKPQSISQRKAVYNVEANLKAIHTNPIVFPLNIEHASCTAIKGEESLHLLPQWIEYHRMIGVEHFFVYINDPFNNVDLEYNQPYITYIPFDYRHYPEERQFYFQATWQNDCIYRGKNASVSWIGIHDIDEYWFIKKDPYDLKSLTTYYSPNVTSGIPIFNVWYGPHPNEPETHFMHKREGNLLLDYVWRSPDYRGPRKNIVSPQLVNYLYVHWITGEKEGSQFGPQATWKIVMNHYRRPYNRVNSFEMESSWNELVMDTSMRDTYKGGVLNAIYGNAIK